MAIVLALNSTSFAGFNKNDPTLQEGATIPPCPYMNKQDRQAKSNAVQSVRVNTPVKKTTNTKAI
jgi:hypothetical protein